MDRRLFLTRSTQTLGLLSIPHLSRAEDLDPSAPLDVDQLNMQSQIPIVQCATDMTSTVLVVVQPKAIDLSYLITNSKSQKQKIDSTRVESRNHSEWSVHKIFIKDLNVRELYQLQVINNANGQVIDQRSFRTLNTLNTNLKFAAASCMNELYSKQRVEMWNAVASSKPDFVLLVGDTVYADNNINNEDEQNYWRRWVECRTKLGYFKIKHLIPTFTTWDDHDFGINNGDERFHAKHITKELFQIFWGNEYVSHLVQGPGVSSIFEMGGQRFFMLDDRFFRSARRTNGSHFGAEQEEFIFSHLHENNKPAWLWNGSQYFGGYLGKESYEKDHTESFQWFLSELAKVEARVCFGAGDVHFSEVMRIEEEILGYQTVEFTSSSIHSFTFPGHQYRARNPRRQTSTSAHNFLFFETQVANNQDWNIHTQSFKKALKLEFSRSHTIKR